MGFKVKHPPQFSFELRGKIQAKGKGEMEIYFVQKMVHDDSSRDQSI